MQGSLAFEKVSRFDRPDEPCSVSVPLARGTVGDAERFVIVDGDRVLPTQATVVARWPDGSAKWVHAEFLADLPGNAGKAFRWDAGGGPAPAPASPVRVRLDAATAELDSGTARLVLGGPGQCPFAALQHGAFALPAGSFLGPMLTDSTGRHWEARLDAAGWRVVRSGPIHAVVEGTGTHRADDGTAGLAFRLRLHAFAGKPWFQVDYRLANLGTEAVSLAAVGLDLRPPAAAGLPRLSLATSNYGSRIRRSVDGTALSHCIDDRQLINESNEQIPETLYGTFWADWTQAGSGGVCVTIFQAHQNFPKALRAHPQGIDVRLYPEASALPLVLRPGVARTQRLLLHAHGGDVDTAELNVRSLQFQMPDRPALPREQYIQAAVFEPVWSAVCEPRVEAFLVDSADDRSRGYGMLTWGDGPDAGYTDQGRGQGKPVWTNNEYDLPHAAMLMFARTGERRMLDYLLVAAEHQMEVDVCHFSPDPLRHGGQITHSAHHVTGGVTPSHEWVEGLLDYYHVTADTTALAVAIGIGENLLRHLERPHLRQPGASSARETGWALRSLTALYRETGEDRWLQPAEAIVGQFAAWRDQYGAWLAPYTDHTLVRVPFMIAVAGCSLMRFHWVRPDPAVADLIVAAARDLLAHALQPDGRFYYTELPSLRRRGAGVYVLELLAYAHDLSGDRTFIEAGLPTFLEALGRVRGGSHGKHSVDDAVICEASAGPKSFASTFLPVAMFSRAAAAAGVPLFAR